MASAKLKGTDSVIAGLRALPDRVRGEITREAVTAGAEELRKAIVAEAPRGSGKHGPKGGRIAENVILYERKNPEAYLQAEKDNLLSILVGPSKRAFHAFFVSRGTKAHEIQGKPLRIPTAGGVIFRRRAKVPGAKPNSFMQRAYAASRVRALSAMKQVYARAVAGWGNHDGKK